MGSAPPAVRTGRVEDRMGEVVRPDTEEVDLGSDRARRRQPRRWSRSSRRSGATAPGTASTAVEHRQPRVLDLVDARDHRQQDAQVRGPGARQDRSQLSRERVGMVEQQLDSACSTPAGRAASCRRRSRGPGPSPVGPGTAPGSESSASVLVLGRPLGRGEESELGAQQADAFGACLQGHRQLGGSRDVCQHAYRMAVVGH